MCDGFLGLRVQSTAPCAPAAVHKGHCTEYDVNTAPEAHVKGAAILDITSDTSPAKCLTELEG